MSQIESDIAALALLRSVASEMAGYEGTTKSAPASIVWSWRRRVADAHNGILNGQDVTPKPSEPDGHGKVDAQPLGHPVMRPDEHGNTQADAETARQGDGGPPCKQSLDAPHGFDRNGSHNAGRYVCDCEGWQATKATKATKLRTFAYQVLMVGLMSSDPETTRELRELSSRLLARADGATT